EGGGGGERQLAILSSGLVRSGWDVHVLTMTSGGQYWSELSDVQGVTAVSLDRVSRFDFSVLLKCVKYIARHRIRVVQGWMQPCNTFAALAGLITRRPAVLSVRSVEKGIVGFGPRMYMHSELILARLAHGTIVCNSRAAILE